MTGMFDQLLCTLCVGDNVSDCMTHLLFRISDTLALTV